MALSTFYYDDGSTTTSSDIIITQFSYDRGGSRILVSAILGDGVTSIANEAFIFESSLIDVSIPSTVTSIGNQAFFDCSAMSKIDIPSSVVSIGDQAFGSCFTLVQFNFVGGGNPPTLGLDVFASSNPNLKIYVYSAGEGWPNTFGGRDVLFLINSPIHQGLQSFGFQNISQGKVIIKKQNNGNGGINFS